MMDNLDITCLAPNASVNRAQLVDVPWLPNDLNEANAYVMLGRPFLVERVLNAFPELAGQEDPLLGLDQLCGEGDAKALDQATDYGKRLAGLLYTLKNGSPKARALRPSWNESYWDFWVGVTQVVIGGGLASGSFGRRAVETANQLLVGEEMTLMIPPAPRYMALLGAALNKGGNGGPRIVLDCGQTTFKSGIAFYVDGCLQRLKVLPVTPCPTVPPAQAILSAMAAVVSECRDYVPTLDRESIPIECVLSLASYVDAHGQPEPRGYFGSLYELGDDIAGLIREAIQARLRLAHEANIVLLHDGSSAALPFAGQPNTASIALGTAMGIGIPPARMDSIRPRTDSFSIEF